ncbi:MAG: hypothetical protein AAF663_00855 [Planctomycetota bacterium]
MDRKFGLASWMSLALLLAVMIVTQAVVASEATTAADTHRDYGPWHSVRFGGGGYLLDAWSSRIAGRWYVWSDVGGLYRSNDDANTWRALHQNLPRGRGDVNCVRGFLEHPANPDRLVLITGTRWRDVGGVWTSGDGGATWTKTLDALFWANAEGRQLGSTLIAFPGEPETLLAAGPGGVFRSEDFGDTWTETGAPEALNPVMLFVDPDDPASCWLSAVPLNTYTQDRPIEAGGGWWHSGDGGRSWSRHADTGPVELVVDPVSKRWIGLIDFMPHVSEDRGRSWSRLDAGLPANTDGKATEISPRRSRALHAIEGRVLLANGQGDLFALEHGRDGQASRWSPLPRRGVDAPGWWYGNTGQRNGWVHFGKSASSITADRHRPGRWLMTDWYAAWMTDDAGKNWAFAAKGIENTVIHGVSLHPRDPNVAFAYMADHGVLRTEDAGQSFEELPMPGHALRSNVKQAEVSPSEPDVVWAIGNTLPGQWESSKIARSVDRGQSWTYAETDGLPDGIARDHFIGSIAVDPADAATAWIAVSGDIGAGGGVFQTQDAGQTWTPKSDGLPQGGPFFTENIWDPGPELVAAPNGDLLAISAGQRRLFRLNAGDSRWESAATLPAEARVVVADPHRADRYWIASQGGGVWRSEDRGQTWSQSFADGVTSIDIGPAGNRIVLGARDGVFVSTDSGTTWSDESRGLLDRFYPHVTLDSDRILVGTKGNGLFVRPFERSGGD